MVTIPVTNEPTNSVNLQMPTIKQEAMTKHSIILLAPDFQGENSKVFYEAFVTILQKKGFTTSVVKTVDDLTYPDKQKAYLLLTAKFKAGLEEKSEMSVPHEYHNAIGGRIQGVGELFIQASEPLTNQALYSKRINLTSLKVSRQFAHERQTKYETTNPASMPQTLHSNVNKMRTEVWNEFFPKAITYINNQISREELLSFEKDIAKLKADVRF